MSEQLAENTDCETGAVRTLTSFAPERPGAAPEGLAIDVDGNIYVGLLNTGEIIKITPDGTQHSLATFEIGDRRLGLCAMLGLAVDGDVLYAVLLTGNLEGRATHGIWRVLPDGTKELAGAIPDPTGKPNQVALDRSGNIYVTDSALGTVWRIARGDDTATAWLVDSRLNPKTDDDNPCGDTAFACGANGLAFDAHGDLYVASANRATILRIEIDPTTGEPTAHEHIRDCQRLSALDQLAIDVEGNVYAARNVANELIRITPGKDIEVLATAADGLDFPSNISFGTGTPAFGTGSDNRTQLYVTNAAHHNNRHLQLIDVGVPGLPMP